MKCYQCGTLFQGKFCPNCGAPAVADATTVNAASSAPITEGKKKKPIYKKWWFWVIVVFSLAVIGNLTDNSQSDSTKIVVADFSTMSKDDIENWATANEVIVKFTEDYSDTVASGSVISQNKKANENIKKGETVKIVLSKGKKPNVESKKSEKYLSSIEWADLNNYCFAVENDSYDGDIISSGSYHFYPEHVSGVENGRIPIVWDIYVSSNLYSNISQLNDKEWIGAVGGISKDELTINLSKGQYVYVKYNPVANNNPTGVLRIEKN